MAFLDRIRTLLGFSAYQASNASSSISEEQLEEIRKQHGGQIQPLPRTQTRWYLEDVEAAEYAADSGDLSIAARLMRSARCDGTLSGVLSTRTDGLVRLPKRFRGDEEIVKELRLGEDEARSIFEEMYPATELGPFAADGLLLGVAVGQQVEVPGRDYPVFVRLDPEFLIYRWNENQWYYRSIGGPVAITPGDGKWILHTPGGRSAPWQNGLWRCIAKAFIRKEHAKLYKDSWESKLANPARVALAPNGAAEEQKQDWWQQVLGWGVNTVFQTSPGYDVKLIESNGRGYQSFEKTVTEQNQEMIIAVAGQTVTTEGGAGFQNSDIHKSIRADLIQSTADSLAYTINTQGIPSFIYDRWGEERLDPGACVEWDVTPPMDRQREATAMTAVGEAIARLTEALLMHGLTPDVREIATRFGIPYKKAEEAVRQSVESARAAKQQPPAEKSEDKEAA